MFADSGSLGRKRRGRRQSQIYRFMAKSMLYTRTGDDGTTSLVDGSRIKKNSQRLETYASIDELSSSLGVVAADAKCNDEIKGEIQQIQNELFNIGAYLATPVKEGTTPSANITEEALPRLEGWIDALDEQTPKLNNFVLPGGCPAAAAAHVARVTCRRAERNVVTLAESEYVDPNVNAYLNRLSDYLFAAARFINFMQGIDDIAWQKNAPQK